MGSTDRLRGRHESKGDEKRSVREHIALLDQYTDKNMHDIVAYLETLK